VSGKGKNRLEVKDKGMAAMFERAQQIKEAYVKVGVLADDEKGGMHYPGGDLTVAEVAAVNEYGTQDGRIPARSFLRSTFEARREELAEMGREFIEKVVDGKLDLAIALGRMGAWLAGKVKRAITDGDGIPPENRPSTVRKKGSSRPLVDTGRMLAAITWSVIVGGSNNEHENE
jgi:hypothetical protein